MSNNNASNLYPEAPQPTLAAGHSSKSRWLMAAAILVIVVLVAALAFHHKKPLSPSAGVIPISYVASANIGDSGFSPASLTLKPDTVVTWKNSGTTLHQVAADPYPLDNSITNFNSKVSLKPGDSYSFEFTKAGTYHVHDQDNPLKSTQTVVVR